MPWASAPKAPWVEVAVAADHGHAGQGGALLRAHHVDDALALVHEGEKAAAPNSAMLVFSVVICSLLMGSSMPS